MIETLAHWYSSESAKLALSNEYQYDRVRMVFKNCCVLVLRMKVALALKGLKGLLFMCTLLEKRLVMNILYV